MITALVQFPLKDGTTLEKAREAYEGSAPKYRGLAGLARKYYLFDAASGIGGGCYLWRAGRRRSPSTTTLGSGT